MATANKSNAQLPHAPLARPTYSIRATERALVANLGLIALLAVLTGLSTWNQWRLLQSWNAQHAELTLQVQRLEQRGLQLEARLAEASRRTSTPSPPPPTIAPSQRPAAQEPRHE